MTRTFDGKYGTIYGMNKARLPQMTINEKSWEKRIVFTLAFCLSMGFAAFGGAEAPTEEARYIESKFRRDVTDRSTGVDSKTLTKRAMELTGERQKAKEDLRVTKAKCLALICDEMSIDVSPLDWFPAVAVYDRKAMPLGFYKVETPALRLCGARLGDLNRGNGTGKWMMWVDFDHSVPVWEELIADGFTGALENVRKADDGSAFYESLKITGEACLRLLARLAAQGRKNLAAGVQDATRRQRLEKQIAALENLTKGPPKTTYEVMLFIDLYFLLSEHIDIMQCRSLSIIDRTLWPFYQADLAAGRTTEAEFREQFRHFLWQWGSINNYWGQPITMGGTKADGTTEYNPLSYVILDVMDECYLTSPKFHIKIGKSTPRPILDKLLDMARRHRSLTFIGEESAWKILGDWGYRPEETRSFYTKGCYEICVPNGANSTGVGYVNLLKPVEEVLKDAAAGKFDAKTYADFTAECTRRMAATCKECREIVFLFEQHLDAVNPANVSTLASRYAIKAKKDAFANGSERGNNTCVEIAALGTTADAFVAVKELVYERKEMTLVELGKLMADNWKDREDLRLRMRRSERKYGNNDPDANAAAVQIQDAIAAVINHVPNSRGGVFGLCGHAARGFINLGGKTGATPDGRKAHEQISKNLSATMGADTKGATALVNTLAALDSSKWPGDFPLDVMLHPSTVEGEKGLELMRTLLDVYFANGGLQIQFNVVSPEELRAAQRDPAKYANLQVRVCGWNVRWIDMPKFEQDEYILRAERIMR